MKNETVAIETSPAAPPPPKAVGSSLPESFTRVINAEKARFGREVRPDLASLMSGSGCAQRVSHNLDKLMSLVLDTVKTIAIGTTDHSAAPLPETLHLLAAIVESLDKACSCVPSHWGRPALRIDARVRLVENAPILAYMPVRLDRDNKRVRPLFSITAIDDATGKVTLSGRYHVAIADIELVK